VNAALLVLVFAFVGCGECLEPMQVDGRIVDTAGAPVTGARVVIVGVPPHAPQMRDLPRETTTDDRGAFSLRDPTVAHDQMCAGAELLVEHPGCEPLRAHPSPGHEGERGPLVLRCDPTR
jgi:hypothetical protein